MKTSSVCIFVLSLTILGFGQCQNPSSKNEVSISTLRSIQNIDPIVSRNNESGFIAGALYENLLANENLDDQLKLKPSLAIALPKVSEDHLTYTFQIRQNVKFHAHKCFKKNEERRLLSTRDILYSIKRAIMTERNHPVVKSFASQVLGMAKWQEQAKSNFQDPIAGIQIDQKTISFQLKAPNPEFPNYFSSTTFSVVSQYCSQTKGIDLERDAVGTGAFQLKKKNGDTIELIRNTEYWNPQYPLVDKITFQSGRSNTELYNSLTLGEVDFIFSNVYLYYSVTKNGTLQKNIPRRISLKSFPQSSTTFLAINMLHPKLGKNLNLRRALVSALNRKTINSSYMKHYRSEAKGMVPSPLNGFDRYSSIYEAASNNQLTSDLLKKAGFPEGRGLPVITLDYIDSENESRYASQIVQELSQHGIVVKTRKNSWSKLFQRIEKKRTELVLLTWTSQFNSPSYFFQIALSKNFYPSGSNLMFYSSPVYDSAYSGLSSFDKIKQHEAIISLERTLATDLPLFPIFHGRTVIFANSWVQKLDLSALVYDALKYMKVDSAERVLLLSENK